LIIKGKRKKINKEVKQKPIKGRKMLNLQYQHNNHTTTPHMIVDPTHWGPPSCEGLLCDCCDGVVYESNPLGIIG
jgi:hypothetical protein